MNIYSGIIKHKELKNLFVYWDDLKRVHSVYLSPTILEMVAIPAEAEEAIPEVYTYLSHFGEDMPLNFTHDALYLDDFTEFTKNVYKTLFYLPRGTVVTYGELAKKAGYPNAYRAVGSAMSKNRMLLLIPCHRVVGVNNLGNFTAGMSVKIKLMEMEGVLK